MASYALNENVDLRLNIDNLTDEEYATSSNWAGSRVFLGNPRTYLVSADFRF
ncbi:Catecholate siderophore receptor Fiu precursor [compost metagenome]